MAFSPNAAQPEAAAQSTKRHVWLEALTEPALISDRGGATVAANARLPQARAALRTNSGDSAHAPSVDRLFAVQPGYGGADLSPVQGGEARRGQERDAARAPLRRQPYAGAVRGERRPTWQDTRSLAPAPHRGRRGGQPAHGSVDSRALYIEDAPVGFFSARRDGRVVYINQTLRQMLGLPDGDNALRLEDIMRPEGLRLMKREVRGAASQRAEVVLRARDGVETSATLITTWAGKGGDALTRSVVYVASAAEQDRRAAGAGRAGRRLQARAMRRARADDTHFSPMRHSAWCVWMARASKAL